MGGMKSNHRKKQAKPIPPRAVNLAIQTQPGTFASLTAAISCHNNNLIFIPEGSLKV
jgi:hypothetical protein